ncbi:MAG: MlaD family protein [Candidatus Saganbacteria bacterium]|nr:MlaD family protein [Candidatus Saganbacteria bacterium]
MSLSTNAKIGIVFFLAAIALSTIIVWKGDLFLKFRGYEIIGSFDDVGGLIQGAEIRYRGYPVGKVLRIIPEIKETKVYIQISTDVRIPRGSTLRVAFDGIVGQKFLEVLPVESKEVVKPNEILYGYKTMSLADFVDVGTEDLIQAKTILESIRKFTSDPSLQKATKETLLNAEEITTQLSKITQEINKVMAKGEFSQLLDSLKRSADLLGKMSERLDSTAKSIESLTADPEFKEDLKAAIKGAKEAMVEFKEAARDMQTTMKKLVK